MLFQAALEPMNCCHASPLHPPALRRVDPAGDQDGGVAVDVDDDRGGTGSRGQKSEIRSQTGKSDRFFPGLHGSAITSASISTLTAPKPAAWICPTAERIASSSEEACRSK